MDTPSDLDLPPRILSLDGGGIRGKSSLLILENIMERIRESQGLNQVPRPCDYFDLIGGTSTGGIIAIMLGRLRMTVDECIQAYDKVGQAAFTPKRRIFPLPASDRNGPVWYGMEVKPYHTSCLHNNRYGLTGKTSNTAKTAKTC
ncbi:acyl transferase/acyl hydrolase/lysophospholipase [Diaporthe sp. PMI_573]|nr:acyl transferase/acyl hydrolase/lysophospholipase [Diaporthaceae sp. PMI_573]